jgi:hypothetical protein
MGKEHVIAFSDKSVPQATQIDVVNGYLYDAAGNQVAKWAPKEDTRDGQEQTMVAEYLADRHMRLMRVAARSPEDVRRDLEQASRGGIVMSHRTLSLDDATDEQLVRMDLGSGDVHLPAAMPNFAGGYRIAAPMADIASPPLLQSQPAGKYFIYDKEDAFQTAAPTVGAPAGSVDEVPPRLSNYSFSTTEYALGGFVATQLEAAADAPLRIRQATAKRVQNVLLLRRETRVAALLQNTSNWNSGNTTTIGAGAQWNGGASSDPIKDIQGRIEASFSDTLSGIVMSELLFHDFQRNPNVQKYFTFKSGTKPLPDAATMSAILELPPIYVARMKSLSATGALSYIWGNDAVLFRMPDQMPPVTQDDIATSYTMRWNVGKSGVDPSSGMAFGSGGGWVVREFFNQVRGSMGGTQLVIVHHDTEIMTSKYVGGLLHNAHQ